jgi:hypothetical protein
MVRGEAPTLYTSMEADGALAEIAFHWGQLNPVPSKPATLHRIHLTTKKSMRLARADLIALDVDWDRYGTLGYGRTQVIEPVKGKGAPQALLDDWDLALDAQASRASRAHWLPALRSGAPRRRYAPNAISSRATLQSSINAVRGRICGGAGRGTSAFGWT